MCSTLSLYHRKLVTRCVCVCSWSAVTRDPDTVARDFHVAAAARARKQKEMIDSGAGDEHGWQLTGTFRPVLRCKVS